MRSFLLCDQLFRLIIYTSLSWLESKTSNYEQILADSHSYDTNKSELFTTADNNNQSKPIFHFIHTHTHPHDSDIRQTEPQTSGHRNRKCAQIALATFKSIDSIEFHDFIKCICISLMIDVVSVVRHLHSRICQQWNRLNRKLLYTLSAAVASQFKSNLLPYYGNNENTI